MKTNLALSIVLAGVLAACGGAHPGATQQPAGGKVDCTKMKAAAAQLIGIQLLAQLTTPENVASIKSQAMGNLDIDALLSALGDLHALDGVSSPFGDTKASIAA